MAATEPTHILVTGAAGAIGGALSRELVARYPNAKQTLVDLDADGLNRTLRAVGARARGAEWDLARPEQLEARVHEAQAAEGPIDALINCAGIMEVRTLATTPWERAELVLAIDLQSPLRLMNLLVPHMVEQHFGIVVNVSSLAGVTPLRGCSYYGAAKAGLAHASEIARIELSPQGVQVLTVYPGPVSSGLERRARDQYQESRARDWIPIGKPEPLARAIINALDRDAPRVVYPRIYDVANRAPRIAGFITSRISPQPRN